MQIGNLNVKDRVMIVAEIGNNHEGSFTTAQELVRQAGVCGVDAVKFQTFQTKYFISARDEARFKRLTSFELSYPQFEQLQQLAKSLGLVFISTPLDLESARFLESLVDAYKIASSDNNFYPLIEQVCQTGKPIIISSGLTDLEQIAKTKRFVEDQWEHQGINQQLAILHCVSSYPVPPEQANLAAIPALAQRLNCTIGYSDHTNGVEACLAAVALGAQIIEKHFTLDKHYSDFRDHQLSADPAEMRRLVEEVARVRMMLGRSEKTVQPCEVEASPLIRRSIAAASDLPQGHRVKPQDLMWIRPGTGLPPGEESQVLDKTLKRAITFGELIQLTDIE